MLIAILVKGFLIGLSIAAPVGPIGMLCIKRTLTHGRLSGFFTGMGAAVADACYGAVAAFGLVGISNILAEYNTLLRIIGGIFLLYLGIKIMRQREITKDVAAKHTSLFKDFSVTVLLTLSNPTTIFSFMAIFAGLGISGYSNTLSSLVMVSGVFLGSMMWWFALSLSVGLMKHKISERNIHVINMCSGFVLLAFSMATFYSLFSFLGNA